jgi:dUTPase
MALVAGNALDPNRFFAPGGPSPKASSFDLTIGSIYDHTGKKVEGPFTIKPNQMVQVVSSEVFRLDAGVTGHVTYKTAMTQKGIWALTVGIVDPGWDGPSATTLLNFSRVDHAIAEGDAFLRVSFFEHDPVPTERLRRAPPRKDYLRGIQDLAATHFPLTFLDTNSIADAAGKNAVDRIERKARVWVTVIAFIFVILQVAVNFASYRPWWIRAEVSQQEFNDLRARMEVMQDRLLTFELANRSPAPAPPSPPAALPTAPPALTAPSAPPDASKQ